ncbi:MAG: T9SS type A sorting domain-containing protein, partial [Bacteroidales bacterium]|nr:T9SS type A sorting domain-containing protein [Bacteroidales bacterium]
LTVYPQAASTINAAICSGQTYTQNGFNVSAAGTYTRVVQNANGCDSTITLVLSVLNGGDTTHIYDNICQGTEYHNNGFNLTNPAQQTYYREETNSGGCQYTIALHLTINNVTTPSNLVTAINNNKIDVSWNGNAEVYELWRNDELLTTMNNTSFIDDQVSVGQQYCYKVKARTGECESDFTAPSCVTITNALDDVQVTDFKVYPNPAQNIVYVEGNGFDLIVLYDLTGREVIRLNANSNKTDINIAHLPNGAYTLRIMSADKIIATKKIIKK